MQQRLIYPLFLLILILSACTPTSQATEPDQGLEATIAAQGTMISHLATRGTGGNVEATIAALDSNFSSLATALDAQAMQTTRQPALAPTVTPRPSSPTPTSPRAYPPEARTTIPEVNAVIEAMLSDDIDARAALVRYMSTACIQQADALGGPPVCNPGEEEGTIVEVFPLSGPEGHFARPDEIEKILDFPVKGLYAVYRVPADAYEEDYWPAGQYGLIFLLAEGSIPTGAIGIIVEDGNIVRLDYYFGDWLLEAFEDRAGEIVLPPLKD